MSERKTTEIKLRVSPEEKTSWQLAAEQREVGLSQFVRDCVWECLYAGSVDLDVIKTLASAKAAPDAKGEDSSVAQAVPTSSDVDLVEDAPRPWMFEARSGD